MDAISDVLYLLDSSEYDDAVAAITDEAFGPGRFVRAAERVREMAPHIRALSFVAIQGGAVVGSVRLTPVAIGKTPVLMLGPLAVRPGYKNRGIGKALMRMAADAAKAAGETVIFLVGDEPYYGPLGYRRLAIGSVTMPRPVDPTRILALPLVEGALVGLEGRVQPR
ncbi:GNAT family N-acetyltransferase [Consotaella salsifontis]|uniref:Predicted N-acetyltransferase YhbS n=1 Tax=Consotaella salsifontis TaxID=1365950 RepID=A0A1T4NW13_9HYPH|nr:N-acetyltransferase [Consotaella salsifontis]SJZ83385.1 Predicted N-acetyltransferase YhbS [Consotaella salsifontis]